MEQPGIVLNIHGGTDKMLYKTFDMLDAGAAVGAVWCRDLFGVTRTRRGLLPRSGPEIDEALYPGLRDAVGVLRGQDVGFLLLSSPNAADAGALEQLAAAYDARIVPTPDAAPAPRHSFALTAEDRRRGEEARFIRRMERAVFRPLMFCCESGPLPADTLFDAERVRRHTVRLSRLHRSLRPYLAERGGGAHGDARLLTPDLLLCPFAESDSVAVDLPQGVWVHLLSGKVYGGGSRYVVPAPPGEPPVFYRAASDDIDFFRGICEDFLRGV